MSEAVFHSSDEVISEVASEVEGIVSQVAPEAEAAVVEPAVTGAEDAIHTGEAVFQDASKVIENGANVAADVAPVVDGIKSTDDLVREIHADIAAVRSFVERISGELEKVGPLGLISALVKGSL